VRPLKIIKDVNCWAIAVLFVVLVALGWYMMGLSFFDRLYHYSLAVHKSLGMIMLLLVVVRIVWIILASRVKKFVVLIPLSKRYGLLAFYLLMLVINITGYLITTSAGKPVEIFDYVSFPALISIKKQALEAAISLHYYLAYGSVILIIVHSLITHRPRILSRLKKR
jgi:cytochrome b561